MQLFFLSKNLYPPILPLSLRPLDTPQVTKLHWNSLMSHQVTLEPIGMHQATRRKLVALFDAQMSQLGGEIITKFSQSL